MEIVRIIEISFRMGVDNEEAVSGDGTEKAGGGCRPFVLDERECNVSDRSTGHRRPPFDLGFVLDLYDC